jgi:hypothetical protein
MAPLFLLGSLTHGLVESLVKGSQEHELGSSRRCWNCNRAWAAHHRLELKLLPLGKSIAHSQNLLSLYKVRPIEHLSVHSNCSGIRISCECCHGAFGESDVLQAWAESVIDNVDLIRVYGKAT